jgi:hypothetical protein
MNATEKQKALRALNYERKMLHATANALASGVANESLLQNALVESFLIHTRLLIEFLYKEDEERRSDDIRPEDWLGPGKWNISEKSALLEQTKKDADKYLVHLTSTRLGGKKKWSIQDIARDIDKALDVFDRDLKGDNAGKPGDTLLDSASR